MTATRDAHDIDRLTPRDMRDLATALLHQAASERRQDGRSDPWRAKAQKLARFVMALTQPESNR